MPVSDLKPRPLSDYSAQELAAIRDFAERHAEPGITQHGPGLCACYPQCYVEADDEDRRELAQDYWQGQARVVSEREAADQGTRPWWRPF
jgi:hypothetical protein